MASCFAGKGPPHSLRWLYLNSCSPCFGWVTPSFMLLLNNKFMSGIEAYPPLLSTTLWKQAFDFAFDLPAPQDPPFPPASSPSFLFLSPFPFPSHGLPSFPYWRLDLNASSNSSLSYLSFCLSPFRLSAPGPSLLAFNIRQPNLLPSVLCFQGAFSSSPSLFTSFPPFFLLVSRANQLENQYFLIFSAIFPLIKRPASSAPAFPLLTPLLLDEHPFFPPYPA